MATLRSVCIHRNEPSELLQWPCHNGSCVVLSELSDDDNTINIVQDVVKVYPCNSMV